MIRFSEKKKEKIEKRRRITLFTCILAGILFFSLFSFFFSLSLNASETINNQPVRIRAQEIEVNQKTGSTVYRGNVSIKQGGLRINADIVKTRVRNGRTQLIKAFGNPAVLRHDLGNNRENLYASANQMVFHTLSGEIRLQDQVLVKKGNDSINGDIVVYHMSTNVITANANNPDSTVQAIIYPGLHEKTPSHSDAGDSNPGANQ